MPLVEYRSSDGLFSPMVSFVSTPVIDVFLLGTESGMWGGGIGPLLSM